LKSAVSSNPGAKCIVWVDKVENHVSRDHAKTVQFVKSKFPDTQIIFVGRPEELQAALEKACDTHETPEELQAAQGALQGASPCTFRVITRSELWHCICCLRHNRVASPTVTISQIAPCKCSTTHVQRPRGLVYH
jgi:hypothetical protein